MPRRVSVLRASKSARREDRDARRILDSAVRAKDLADNMTTDSFQNFQAKLGIGTDNIMSAGTYGFNPITRNRILLEWIHRGSWLGGVAVDVVADDMTRAGVSIEGELEPEQIREIEELSVAYGVWESVKRVIKWGRLYGGCIGLLLVDGQDISTPFRVDTVGPGQFRGILPLDRWMVDPSLNDLVTELGPYLGKPKYYRIMSNAPAFRGKIVHYSRIFRLEGSEVPYNQALTENLWSISVLERLYDRMVAFDSASTGAAQLVFKAYIRTYKVKQLREIVAAGGEMLEGLVKYVDMMRRFQSVEGITLLDSEDEMQAQGHQAFAGLSDALEQFGQQLAGALQIPLVRLFGQSPAGLNSTGESDLRMYYDGINQQQNSHLLVPITNVYRCLGQSLKIKIPTGFGIKFRPLWQLTEQQKAETAGKVTETVTRATDSMLVSQQTALKELRQSSEVTGVWSNITDEDINNAESEILPPVPEGGPGSEEEDTEEEQQSQNPKDKKPAKAKVKDGLASAAALAMKHGLYVVVENIKGSVRTGPGWSVLMPADYGYIRTYPGADGDQIDCYIGEDPGSPKVFVVDQLNLATGTFDEHKVMLCFGTREDALLTYVSGFHDGFGKQRIGAVSEVAMDVFKGWLNNGEWEKPYDHSVPVA